LTAITSPSSANTWTVEILPDLSGKNHHEENVFIGNATGIFGSHQRHKSWFAALTHVKLLEG
jgi:hypothetical protein